MPVRTAAGRVRADEALSTANDAPEGASRPFDAGRDGFVLGEGAAVLVLERAEFARFRGARAHGALGGAGATSSAQHITASDTTSGNAIGMVDKGASRPRVPGPGTVCARWRGPAAKCGVAERPVGKTVWAECDWPRRPGQR